MTGLSGRGKIFVHTYNSLIRNDFYSYLQFNDYKLLGFTTVLWRVIPDTFYFLRDHNETAFSFLHFVKEIFLPSQEEKTNVSERKLNVSNLAIK